MKINKGWRIRVTKRTKSTKLFFLKSQVNKSFKFWPGFHICLPDLQMRQEKSQQEESSFTMQKQNWRFRGLWRWLASWSEVYMWNVRLFPHTATSDCQVPTLKKAAIWKGCLQTNKWGTGESWGADEKYTTKTATLLPNWLLEERLSGLCPITFQMAYQNPSSQELSSQWHRPVGIFERDWEPAWCNAFPINSAFSQHCASASSPRPRSWYKQLAQESTDIWENVDSVWNWKLI